MYTLSEVFRLDPHSRLAIDINVTKLKFINDIIVQTSATGVYLMDFRYSNFRLPLPFAIPVEAINGMTGIKVIRDGKLTITLMNGSHHIVTMRATITIDEKKNVDRYFPAGGKII